jgi:pyochelin biosynthetic protein PchC
MGVGGRGGAVLAGESGGGSWIRSYRRVPGGVPLFCFPHAGGAASYFHPWSASLAPGIEVLAVQYPGREDRAVEPYLTNIADLADQIHAALGSWLPGTFAFFGHSMGAIIAFEVARRIGQGEAGRGPTHMFVSGRPGPPRHRNRDLHRAGNPALIAELRSLGATDPRLLENSEVLELILPTMRADYTASETYRFEPGPPLSCDITAMIGDRDSLNTIEDATAWSAHTTGAFGLRVYPGGHFYLDDCRAQVLKVISSSLAGGAASHTATSAAAGPSPSAGSDWSPHRSG